MENYDFCGWATRANLRCSDGRTIMRDAFKHHDNKTVPLVWMHQHNDPANVLGHALLKNLDEGLYAYCTFNDTESGQMAKQLVEHGDVSALSIHATRLKQDAGNVTHGTITEVSLVLAGANPGAYIESVMSHGEESDEEAVIYTGEDIVLAHAEDDIPTEEEETAEEQEGEKESETNTETDADTADTEVNAEADAEIEHGDGTKEEKPDMAEAEKKPEAETETESKGKTVGDVLDTLTEEQMTAVCALIGQALEDAGVTEDDEDTEDESETESEENKNIKHSEGGNETMNVFEKNNEQKVTVLSHADQEAIVELAKSSRVGTLQDAIKAYMSEHTELAHAENGAVEAWDVSKLFPDYQNVPAGAPGVVGHDNTWVADVMKKTKKNPASRIRTRHASLLADEYKAKGYNSRENAKTVSEGVKMILRTTDPQTVYVRDELHRDDIIDMDFDIIAFQKNIMKGSMEETVAVAALIGDGLDDTNPDKISETHIRPVWTDHDVFTIKATVNGAMENLQGTDTAANFGANYIFAEAFLETSLTARLQYRGKGIVDLYCAPSVVNKMLLARDLNGRRIYDSVADLAKALNVGAIHSVEQMEGRTRENGTRKLLGIFVNMANYTFGSTKGGEITSFEQFDIDFNKHKYLMESRVSGALTEPYSAIAIEEEVVAG